VEGALDLVEEEQSQEIEMIGQAQSCLNKKKEK